MDAADYVVKPFSPTELAARIRAALREQFKPEQDEPSAPYASGDLSIDYAGWRVTLAGEPVEWTATVGDSAAVCCTVPLRWLRPRITRDEAVPSEAERSVCELSSRGETECPNETTSASRTCS